MENWPTRSRAKQGCRKPPFRRTSTPLPTLGKVNKMNHAENTNNNNNDMEERVLKELQVDGKHNTPCNSRQIAALADLKTALETQLFKSLSRDQLERMVVDKICEMVVDKNEISGLRKNVEKMEQRVESWKSKAAQLTRDIRNMKILANELNENLRNGTNTMKPYVPNKYGRSVGLQVMTRKCCRSALVLPAITVHAISNNISTETSVAVQSSFEPFSKSATKEPDKKPAAEVDTSSMASTSTARSKPIPPKPMIKAYRVGKAVKVMWHIERNLDDFEKIASYQIRRYVMEPAGSNGTAGCSWSSLGAVRAMKLPMSCALNNVGDDNSLHVAIAARDVQGRDGECSDIIKTPTLGV